jgi:uncharacterized protein YjiS (DUF1127 family)
MTQVIENEYSQPGRLVAGLRRLMSNWRKRHRLLELQQLDDHILKDIGIDRVDLIEAANGPLGIDPLCELERRVRLRRRQAMPDATRRWLRDRGFSHPRIGVERWG